MSTPPAVSVLLPAPSAADRLRQTMTWLDAQTIGYADYQVVFIPVGQDRAARARLAELSRHRPNVTVAGSADAGDAGDAGDDPTVDWKAGLAAATGEYVLLLGPDDRLQRRALAALLEVARGGDCDVVLGRGSGDIPVGFVPELLISGRPSAADLGIALLAPCALFRTDLLAAAFDRYPQWRAGRVRAGLSAKQIGISQVSVAVGPGPAGHQPIEDVWREVAAAAEVLAEDSGTDAAARFVAAHLASTTRRHPELDPVTAATAVDLVRRYVGPETVSGLAPYQRGVVAAVLASEQSDQYADAVRAIGPWLGLTLTWTTESLHWVDGRLTVAGAVAVRANETGMPDGADAVIPRLVLRNLRTTEIYPIATEVSPGAESASPADRASSHRVRGAVDITDAAAGAGLDAGNWQLLVRLLGAGAEAPKSATVAHSPVPGAIVDGTFVRPYAHDGQLRLEVEGGDHGVFGRYTPDAATITETADGALLTLSLEDLATRGTVERQGHLLLGDFALPATLRVDADGARLECYLSGLAGVNPLSLRIPPGPKHPLGLQLRIGAAGDMAIEPVPAAESKPAARTAPKSAEPAEKPVREPDRANQPNKSAAKPATKPAAKGRRESSARAVEKPTRKSPSAPTASSPAVRVASIVGRRVLPKPARRRVRRMLRRFL